MSPLETRGRYDTATDAPRQVISSPEQVELVFPIAGPTVRILAYSIDYVLVLLVQITAFVTLIAATPLASSLSQLFEEIRESAATGDPRALQENSSLMLLIAAFLVLQLVVEWGYFICIEFATRGRSLGKILTGLRVLRDDGLPIGLRDCALRNLLRAVDILPGSYFVGLLAMVYSPRGKRLGDLAAGTIVVRLDRSPAATPLAALAAPSSAFRFDREQLGRLGPAERRLLRQALRRLESLSPELRRTVVERTARVLCERIGYGVVDAPEYEAFLRALLHATAGQ